MGWQFTCFRLCLRFNLLPGVFSINIPSPLFISPTPPPPLSLSLSSTLHLSLPFLLSLCLSLPCRSYIAYKKTKSVVRVPSKCRVSFFVGCNNKTFFSIYMYNGKKCRSLTVVKDEHIVLKRADEFANFKGQRETDNSAWNKRQTWLP